MTRSIQRIVFKRIDGDYIDSYCDNDWLGMLGESFDDGKPNNNWIVRELMDPESKGITGNKIDITFKGDKVFIEPLYTKYAAEFRIEIDRKIFLDLILKWDELIKQKPDEIVITQDEQGNLDMQAVFYKNKAME